ncbi:hypothetical protein BJV74DRAFT_887813 [Russula compacta]|nr:hypothetical protein BJV74DRAFT_887813 [Russula compacta]
MRIIPYLVVALLPLAVPSFAQAEPFPVPLEVRSPYLNFWTFVPFVSNTTASAEETALANVTGLFLTPTRTIFTLEVGPVEVDVTFFSPIEPDDLVRQSIPFTYISFDFRVTDGYGHEIQLYMHMQSGIFFDSNAENITWSVVSTGRSVYEMTQLPNQHLFSENENGQAEWGQIYFATTQSEAVSYGIDSAKTLVSSFSTQGSLNSPNSSAESVSNISTAFAFSRDLGNVTANATTVFAFGFVQDPAVRYIDPTGRSQHRFPYFKTMYSSVGDLIDSFLDDYTAASSRALELEAQIANDASGLPDGYSSVLLSLATRLVYASTVLTVGETSDGVLNLTDVMMFMKNIDSASDRNRVNPVEVLYNAFPMFMYFNSTQGGLLLEPLLRNQNSPYYTQQYAARDAGTSYPNASFSNDIHLQETANMLIMTYVYAQASGDGTLIETNFDLLRNWTNFLVGSTLYTTNQESADLLNINNQTNLAIKGIIAIKAMSLMCAAISQPTDYSDTAESYYNQWRSLALAQDNHVLIQYGNESSWSLGYNMFADIWLRTGLISQDIISAHVDFLKTVNFTVAPSTLNTTDAGIPLDSLRPNNVTYSSNMFAAAFGDTGLQDLIVSGMMNHPAFDDYGVINSTAYSVRSPSPDLGSAYAPLVLLTPARGIMTNTSLPFPHVGSSKPRISAGRKVGIAFASILGGALLAAGLLVAFRRRRLHHRVSQHHWRHVLRGPGFMGALGAGDAMELNSVQSQTTLRPIPEAGWKSAEGDASLDGSDVASYRGI